MCGWMLEAFLQDLNADQFNQFFTDDTGVFSSSEAQNFDPLIVFLY